MSIRRAAIVTVAAFVAATGSTVPASVARAGGYVCTIPRALLCDGCASQVAITLVRGGTCRVSFTPVAPGTPLSPGLGLTGGPGANPAPANPAVDPPPFDG